MDLEEIINIIETDFLKLLIQHLKSGKVKLQDARTSTKEFLALLPFADKSDLQSKLKAYTETHSDFKQIYITFLKIEEEKKSAELIMRMKEYIKEGKIDEALNLVK